MTSLDRALSRLKQRQEITFVQHQGTGNDVATLNLGGACAALSIKWAGDVGTGKYSRQEWGARQSMYDMFTAPANTPIGRMFPKLTAPGAGHTKVSSQVIAQQQFGKLAGDVDQQMVMTARSQGRHITEIARHQGLKPMSPQGISELLERYEDRYRGGLAVMVISGGKAHAMAIQLAGGLARYYDPNAGEFCFQSRESFRTGFWDLYDSCGYNEWAKVLRIYQVY
ncbi:MAG: YopT-type cysteine protease domain-containing protein [Planctomycetota bacterium]